MKKLILLLLFISLCTKLYSQDKKVIAFTDTVKISGALIYDEKQKVFKIKRDIAILPNSLKKITKTFESAEYYFLQTIDVKSIVRKETGNRIEFCNNENSEIFQTSRAKKIYGRYYVFLFKDIDFINIAYGKRIFLTFKCW